MESKTINIEPSWNDILNLCIAHADTTSHKELIEMLRPCTNVMDSVRRAQQEDKHKVILSFTPGTNEVTMQVR